MNLKTKLTAEMKHTIDVQNDLYDSIVLPALGEDDFPDAYQRYLKELGGFDAKAYNKTIERIEGLKGTNPKEFANWSERFSYIPEYITHRNNFDDKTKEIRQMDGSQADKQAIWDTLDRNRTRAHNGVISLFNSLNEFATENKIAQPYPTAKPFNKNNAYDREQVAEILSKHTTILEVTNSLLLQEKTTESDTERYRTMSFSELLKIAKEKVVELTSDDLSLDDASLQM